MQIRTLSVLAFVLIAVLAAGFVFTGLSNTPTTTPNYDTNNDNSPSMETTDTINDAEPTNDELTDYTYEVNGSHPNPPKTTYISAQNVTLTRLNQPNVHNVSFNVSAASVERWIIYFINQERKERGLAPIDRNETIATYARAHSYQLARHDAAGHYDYDGLKACGYEGIEGSQIQIVTVLHKPEWEGGTWYYQAASAKRLARSLVASWMHSTGHRNVILARNTEINAGAGVYFDYAPNADNGLEVKNRNYDYDSMEYPSHWDTDDIVVQATVHFCTPNRPFEIAKNTTHHPF